MLLCPPSLSQPVEHDGPVDGDVEPLSDRQRRVGNEAQAGVANVDSATAPVFSRPMVAYYAISNLQVERNTDTITAVWIESLQSANPRSVSQFSKSKGGGWT